MCERERERDIFLSGPPWLHATTSKRFRTRSNAGLPNARVPSEDLIKLYSSGMDSVGLVGFLKSFSMIFAKIHGDESIKN